jgi:ketosteroid isomerase-like protein
MKRIFSIIIITVAALLVVFAQTQDKAGATDEKARKLSRFESKWLIAGLNDDKGKISKIFDEDVIAAPFIGTDINSRTEELSKMIDPALLPSEMKVRISGNIVVLTNSASENDSRGNSDSRNRSYHFLDTFNKRNGKWEIIATHFSRISAPNNLNDEQTVMRLARERDAAAIKKDIAFLRQVIADDFVGIEASGRKIDKLRFIKDIETENDVVQSNIPTDIKINVSGDTAVLTGRKQQAGVNKNGKYSLRLVFTEIWTKRSGQWQITNYQATRTT